MCRRCQEGVGLTSRRSANRFFLLKAEENPSASNRAGLSDLPQKKWTENRLKKREESAGLRALISVD